MARHSGLPKAESRILKRSDLLAGLQRVDENHDARQRVLEMETQFRTRIQGHVDSLPTNDARFAKFNTSPYVLLIYSLRHGYSRVSQIEGDILPAKVFSSMETSAGRMIEAVVLPFFGWECVESEMHTVNSALDGRRLMEDVACVATLKSGPRCLNDEMAENFADAIIVNAEAWAAEAGAKRVDFTYGVLYGTERQSNKKDWHVLRKLREKVESAGGEIVQSPDDGWQCVVTLDGITTTATVRIGSDWWQYLGGSDDTLIEVLTSLIRACVLPGEADSDDHPYLIADLGEIVSLSSVADDYNVSLLQRSQLPWLFFIARHFCDALVD